MQNTDTPTPPAVSGLPDAAGSAFTPTTEEFLQAIKEGCEELADERNYQIPAWCPETIAAKLARYADTALMQLRATKPNEWTQQPPETAQKTMDNSDTQESADTAQSTHSEAVGCRDLVRLDDVLLIRCIRHINIRQQNATESTGAECGGCIAEERDRLRGILANIEEMCHRLAFGRKATTAEIIAALRETMKKANAQS